jgi:hypothetical protein
MEDNIADSKDFYDNLRQFHDRIKPITKLINDFTKTRHGRKKLLSPVYAAVRVENGEVKELYNFPEADYSANELKDIIQDWVVEDLKYKYIKDIYKIELRDRVFLFKIFQETNNKANFVMAGYIIKDSMALRSFMTSLNEYTIQERYEQLLMLV